MYERWSVRSGAWDSVHLFPINTESMECKIGHNQNVRIGLLKKKKRLVQKYIFIFESFILVGRFDPKYLSDPFCCHEEFDEGSKWVLGERGVNIDYIPKNIYMYIYI